VWFKQEIKAKVITLEPKAINPGYCEIGHHTAETDFGHDSSVILVVVALLPT
jgi:hypothetical protein